MRRLSVPPLKKEVKHKKSPYPLRALRVSVLKIIAPAPSPRLGDVALLSTILALITFFIPALQPLLRSDFTCGYDNAFHLWRAVQVGHLWDQGIFYSRWAPDMAHGFGFPLLLFMPPGTAFIAAFLNRLGMVWPLAINATFVLGIVLGGIATFFLAHELFGSHAGMVAAVTYVYAPFLAYDAFNRGSLSETFAWAFPPLIVWALHRWILGRERRFLLLGTLSFALMLWCHHPFAFLFAPLFAAWVLLSAYLAGDWRVVGRGMLFGLLGLGIGAFFWLPPLLERDWVQTGRLLGTWVFDYRYNFISLEHLLALPRLADPALINDWPEKSLGAVPVAAALLALLRWRHFSRPLRWRVGMLWGLAIGFAFLTLSPSLWLWEHIPLLSYVQFPWRFLGPAAFCVALLSGASLADVLDEGYAECAKPQSGVDAHPSGAQVAHLSRLAKFWPCVLLMLVLAVANLGWFYPRHCAPPSDLSVQGMIAWERATDTLGTTAKGEYLPVWVERMPDVSLDQDYARNGPVIRLSRQDLPEGVTVLREAYGALSASLDVDASRGFQMRYLAFYYPGWQAWVDGEPVAVAPEPETGLLTFWVPPGQHTIKMRFRETPLRLVADGLSLLSLGALFLVVWRCRDAKSCVSTKPRAATIRSEFPHSQSPCSTASSHVPSRGHSLLLLLVAVVFSTLKVTLLDAIPTPWRHSRLHKVQPGAASTLRGVAVPLDINFDNRARLLGMDALPDAFPADAAPEVRLYGEALNPGGQEWRIGLDLLGADGMGWMPDGLRPVRAARTPPPMQEWPPESYALWAYHLDVVPGIPPGEYALEVSLFDRVTLEPASVLGVDGNPVGPSARLGTVYIERPQEPWDLAALELAGDARLQRCDALGLWAMMADREDAAPGDPVGLRWVWETLSPPATTPLTMTVTLRQDPQSQVLQAWELPPVATWWPTDKWRIGDRWVGRHVLRLPGGLQSGRYQLEVTLPGCASLALVTLDVTAPVRMWDVPPDIPMASAEVLGGVVRLAGFAVEPPLPPFPRVADDLAPDLEVLRVHLAWQAVAEMDASYRVFVHLLGPEGHLWAQSDGEPSNWTRPTTGWAAGEVVVDARALQIPADAPAGDYTLWAGLYLPNGPRLRTAAGDDAIALGVLSLCREP